MTLRCDHAPTNCFDLVQAHIDRITPEHREAFRGPIPLTYAVGDLVWMWDHYNTAVVVTVVSGGRVKVRTSDADGSTQTYDYKPAHLRPAARTVEFRWSEAA